MQAERLFDQLRSHPTLRPDVTVTLTPTRTLTRTLTALSVTGIVGTATSLTGVLTQP